jgi:hypothetical protein
MLPRLPGLAPGTGNQLLQRGHLQVKAAHGGSAAAVSTWREFPHDGQANVIRRNKGVPRPDPGAREPGVTRIHPHFPGRRRRHHGVSAE